MLHFVCPEAEAEMLEVHLWQCVTQHGAQHLLGAYIPILTAN